MERVTRASLYFLLGGLASFLGMWLPLLWKGAAQPFFARPELLPDPSRFWPEFWTAFPHNLGVSAFLFLLGHYSRRCCRWVGPYFFPLWAFYVGTQVSGAGIPYGGRYMILALPLALGEILAYALALAGGEEKRPLALLKAGGVLFFTGIYEAWLIAYQL